MDLTWRNQSFSTHVGTRTLPTATISGGGQSFQLIDVSSLFPDQNPNWKRPHSDITGFAWHHDAVHPTPTGIVAEFARLQAIYNWHINLGGMRQPGAPSWNGIGYHAVMGDSNRIYLPRRDVLDTHRAHTAGGSPPWNRRLIGFCHMGSFVSGRQPTPRMKAGADAFMRHVTDVLGKTMTLAPHKRYQSDTTCPGTWAAADAWSDVRFQPRKTDTQPIEEEPPEEEDMSPGYDFVQAGDTFNRIAERNELTPHTLRGLNAQIPDYDLIEVGQGIRLRNDVPLPPLIPIAGKHDTAGAKRHIQDARAALDKADAAL